MPIVKRLFFEYGLRFSISIDSELAEDGGSSVCLPTWEPRSLEDRQASELEFHLSRGQRRGEHLHALYVNGRLEMGGASRSSFLTNAAKRVHWWLAKESRDCVFIHAGVVGIDGCAVMLPGRSYVGKSTLVAELLGNGSAYLSDEYAVLTEAGMVLPFPRKLSLRDGSSDFRPRLFETMPIVPGAIYFVEYQPGATWMSRRLSTSEAVLRLFENCVGARAFPEITLARLVQLCRNFPAFIVVRGEVQGAARSLLEDFRQDRG